MSAIKIGNQTITSRLFLGTARYPSHEILRKAILASQTQVITVSLRRESPQKNGEHRFWDYLKDLNVHILPNTAGCTSAKEAVLTAHMARDLFGTNWIKLEVIGNDDSLQPNPFATLEAARILVAEGFEVFPYTTDDLVVAEKLVEVGCRIIMPWGSPIGSGQGIRLPQAIRSIRRYFPEINLILDAGIGAPSQAAFAMELGCDAVLVNTAVARSRDPIHMAKAFADSIDAGKRGFQAGLMLPLETATASTPTVGIPFWHQ